MRLLKQLARQLNYSGMSQSRLDTLILKRVGDHIVDYAKLYEGYKLKFTRDHYWIRFKERHFYLGVGLHVIDVVKRISHGELSHKEKALVGERIGQIRNMELDVELTAPFPISEMKANLALEWDYRFLNHESQNLWLFQGKTAETQFGRLLEPETYNSRRHVIRW